MERSLSPLAEPAALLPLTRGAALIVGGCCLLFLLGVVARLNGSSSSFWYTELSARAEAKGVIAGSPKPTRSDEWMVWTPAILSQLHQRPPMPVKNNSLGAGVSPIIMSIPVRHYSMFFRPQLWGFFLFDAERGFAWFWNAKIFALLLSFFLLFLALLRGPVAPAFFASLAVSYSSFTQWWFSSPPMLPEMLSSWALAVLASWILFRRNPACKKLVAALVLIMSAINFLLCCYPPFQVPLLYLALFLFGAFLWQRRASSLHDGFFWLGGCVLLIAALLWPLFEQCRSTLELVAHTSYPGARRISGGGITPSALFSGLLNFFDGEHEHPDSFPNMSEGANFFPLWIAALLFVGWKTWPRAERAKIPNKALYRSLALAGYIVLFSFYATVGFPQWLSRITLLSFCTEKRSIFGVGIAGLMLSFLALSRHRPLLASARPRTMGVVGVVGFSLGYLFSVRGDNPVFLGNQRLWLLLGTDSLLAAAYLCARPAVFGGFFAGALLLNNFLVNPIAQGLPGLLESSAARQIAAVHNKNPTATWAAYGGIALPQLIVATGAPVLNGVKIVPDLDLMRSLDPTRASEEIYNRYAYILFQLPPPGETQPHFILASPDAYFVFVRPTHPALRRAGLKYVAFPRALAAEEAAGLQLIEAMPASGIYIYELK